MSLANDEEVRVLEWEREAFPRVVKTIYRQDDLERRLATLTLRRDPRTIPIDNRIRVRTRLGFRGPVPRALAVDDKGRDPW